MFAEVSGQHQERADGVPRPPLRLTGVLLVGLRPVTIPALTLIDYLPWPVALATVAEGTGTP